MLGGLVRTSIFRECAAICSVWTLNRLADSSLHCEGRRPVREFWRMDARPAALHLAPGRQPFDVGPREGYSRAL